MPSLFFFLSPWKSKAGTKQSSGACKLGTFCLFFLLWSYKFLSSEIYIYIYLCINNSVTKVKTGSCEPQVNAECDMISGESPIIIAKYDEIMLLWCCFRIVRSLYLCIHQMWSEWPTALNWNSTLGQAGLSDTGLLSRKNSNSYPKLRHLVFLHMYCLLSVIASDIKATKPF